MSFFAPRTSVAQVEKGDDLAPRFGPDGLLPVVTTDAASGAILMLGYMNTEALTLTLATGEAHYWSRSRQEIWHKGEHSGFRQRVTEMLVDDDQDALVIKVELLGPGSCHVGYFSCFYRSVDLAGLAPGQPARLQPLEAEAAFDAETVYAGLENPTIL